MVLHFESVCHSSGTKKYRVENATMQYSYIFTVHLTTQLVNAQLHSSLLSHLNITGSTKTFLNVPFSNELPHEDNQAVTNKCGWINAPYNELSTQSLTGKSKNKAKVLKMASNNGKYT